VEPGCLKVTPCGVCEFRFALNRSKQTSGIGLIIAFPFYLVSVMPDEKVQNIVTCHYHTSEMKYLNGISPANAAFLEEGRLVKG